MAKIPAVLQNLIDELAKLPGIGKRSARRITFHLLRSSSGDILALSEALKSLTEDVVFCSICHNISESNPCEICNDDKRDSSVLCVVEDITDLLSIESSGLFNGKYHVLGGVIDPLSGVDPDDLFISDLISKVKKENIEEVIMATNPTTEGDTTAMYIARLLRDYPVKISRIARGLPVGANLEYTDNSTLARAFENRTIEK